MIRFPVPASSANFSAALSAWPYRVGRSLKFEPLSTWAMASEGSAVSWVRAVTLSENSSRANLSPGRIFLTIADAAFLARPIGPVTHAHGIIEQYDVRARDSSRCSSRRRLFTIRAHECKDYEQECQDPQQQQQQMAQFLVSDCLLADPAQKHQRREFDLPRMLPLDQMQQHRHRGCQCAYEK